MIKKAFGSPTLATWYIILAIADLICSIMLSFRKNNGVHNHLYKHYDLIKDVDHAYLKWHLRLHWAALVVGFLILVTEVASICINYFCSKTEVVASERRQDYSCCQRKSLIQCCTITIIVLVEVVWTVIIVLLAVMEFLNLPQEDVAMLLRDVIGVNPALMGELENSNGCCGMILKSGGINYPNENCRNKIAPNCTDQLSESLIGKMTCIFLLIIVCIPILFFIRMCVNRVEKCCKEHASSTPTSEPDDSNPRTPLSTTVL
uniref:Tetraspanin n=1 Tax=Plectus sambesii TaxID=2011161 RepID=A0A914XRI0_9BILA